MITRSKDSVTKPNPRYVLLTHKMSYTEPKIVTMTLKDPCWTKAMNEEMDNCSEIKTWSLIPYTPCMHVLDYKWVFRTKLNVDDSMDNLKARLIAKRFNQEEGITYLKTSSHVVSITTIGLVLHVATIMQ